MTTFAVVSAVDDSAHGRWAGGRTPDDGSTGLPTIAGRAHVEHGAAQRLAAMPHRGRTCSECGIVGLGIDVEVLARARNVVRTDARFLLERRFTAQELARCRWDPKALLVCYTAKEAVAKALGVGLDFGGGTGVPCNEVELVLGFEGQPQQVVLSGSALAASRCIGMRFCFTTWRWNDLWVCAVAVGLGDWQPLSVLGPFLDRAFDAGWASVPRHDAPHLPAGRSTWVVSKTSG